MKVPVGYYVGRKKEFTEHDYEWLYTEYAVKGKSSYEIASDVGTCASTVCNWLNAAGLTRSRAERGRRHSKVVSGERNPAWNGGGNVGYHLRKLKRTREQRCKWCGATEKVVMHHIDHDRANGADDNLIWLCRGCHFIATGLHMTALTEGATSEFNETTHELTISFRRQ